MREERQGDAASSFVVSVCQGLTRVKRKVEKMLWWLSGAQHVYRRCRRWVEWSLGGRLG